MPPAMDTGNSHSVVWQATALITVGVPVLTAILNYLVERAKAGVNLKAERKRVCFERFHKRQATVVDRAYALALRLRELAIALSTTLITQRLEDVPCNFPEMDWTGTNDFIAFNTASTRYENYITRNGGHFDIEGQLLELHRSLLHRFHRIEMLCVNEPLLVRRGDTNATPLAPGDEISEIISGMFDDYERLRKRTQEVLSGA